MQISLLDYGAGNVRSVRNAIRKLGFTVVDVKTPGDIRSAKKLIFPGVGSFGSAMERLKHLGYIKPLIAHIKADKPFLGICLGLQTLFESSEETPGVQGLSVIAGQVRKFDETKRSVPQIGWNGVRLQKNSPLFNGYQGEKLYFVHSYHVVCDRETDILGTTQYGYDFVSAVQNGNLCGTQFHPEKSHRHGMQLLRDFLESV